MGLAAAVKFPLAGLGDLPKAGALLPGQAAILGAEHGRGLASHEDDVRVMGMNCYAVGIVGGIVVQAPPALATIIGAPDTRFIGGKVGPLGRRCAGCEPGGGMGQGGHASLFPDAVGPRPGQDQGPIVHSHIQLCPG